MDKVTGEIVEDGILQLRGELDKLDKTLATAFIDRMKLVRKISAIKHEKGLPIFDRVREEKILASRMQLVDDPALKPCIKDFFAHIMDISKAEQRRVYNKAEHKADVVYQGVPGSYSHQAVIQHFRDGYNGITKQTFADVFTELAKGKASYGVLPLENSSTGSINEVYDLLIRFGCFIVGEQIVEVDHCLLGLPDSEISDIQKVFSHEQGLQQCQNFLNNHKLWEQIPYQNTATSAKHVSESGNKHWGAIASRTAAQFYGLKVLAENIQNQFHNYTRFIIVSPEQRQDENCNKASLSFVLKHETGSLAQALAIFSENKLNLLKLESRPINGEPWKYRFYVDVAVTKESSLKSALTKLEQACHEWRFFGTYPAAMVKL